MKKHALYFGCRDGIGHYLWGVPGFSNIYPQDLIPDFPWNVGLLDSGLLMNGKVPVIDDGRVFGTVAWDRSICPTCSGTGVLVVNRQQRGQCYWCDKGKVGTGHVWWSFYWWDNTVDKRPKSNSGFYVRGFLDDQRNEAFEFAKKAWPDVVERRTTPLVLQPLPGSELADKNKEITNG